MHLAPILINNAAVARFWKYVEITDSCWLWRGPAITPKGYARIRSAGRYVFVHRFSWRLANGPIPEGLTIDHLCRNRLCVNPAHLEPVTVRENLMRGNTHAAANIKKTHCPYDHPFSGANLYINPQGKRFCRRCQNDAMKRYWRRTQERKQA